MGFLEVCKSVGGLTHLYPLDATYQAKDAVGTVHGTNHGATFDAGGAAFNGSAYVELPDHADFSAATTGALTVMAFLTITDWRGAKASEYVHWMGKGVPGQHEWTFRHYVDGGTGEAGSRQKRVSFYCFNLTGGLGAGSYFQDTTGTSEEHLVAGQIDTTRTYMVKDGSQRDADLLSGYNIKPTNGSAPVRIGTRDLTTGFLVGKIRRVAFFNRKISDADFTKIMSAKNLPITDTAPEEPDPTPTEPTDPYYVPSGSTKARLIRAHNALVKALQDKGVL